VKTANTVIKKTTVILFIFAFSVFTLAVIQKKGQNNTPGIEESDQQLQLTDFMTYKLSNSYLE
jgi:hypothetical protein